MTLKARIQEDMKSAMRAKDSERLGAIRLAFAAIRQREIDERIELDDAGVVMVIEKLIKQRKDSISQYQAANRLDLSAKEEAELAVLTAYMPQQMTAEEVAALVQQAVTETGASSAKDMGKLMAWLKPKLAGRADMSVVSAQVKAALN